MGTEAMSGPIVYLTALNVLFLLMHEFDAFHLGEWNMFGFLKGAGERARYLIFLYGHVLLVLILLFYLYAALTRSYFTLWLGVNAFCIGHLALHQAAKAWKTNVFTSLNSDIFIFGAALTSLVNLVSWRSY